MNPENITHKLMGLYMEVLILGVILWYMVLYFCKRFPIGCRLYRYINSLPPDKNS